MVQRRLPIHQNYLYKLEDYFDKSDANLSKTPDGRAVANYHAVKMHDAPNAQGGNSKDTSSNTIERANYAVIEYAHRLHAVENENGETKGVLIDRKSVRLGDDCAQILLKIQIITAAIRKLVDGK